MHTCLHVVLYQVCVSIMCHITCNLCHIPEQYLYIDHDHMHRQLGLFNHDLKSYESINIKRTTSGKQLSNEYIEKRNTLIGLP